MAKDISDGVPVGYVNPLVIAPLERRDVVWKKFAAEHKWQQRFAAGKFSHAVADDNAKLATPALKTHPDVKAVFATYGIDISDADIELMTKENSPWRATATTDPSAIGAGVTRALTLELAGQLGTKRVVFPGRAGYPGLYPEGADQEHGRPAREAARAESLAARRRRGCQR
jgi:simple sugar transport system substrate-binding protein